MISVLGIVLLVALGAWFFGGFVLRVGGALLILAGAFGLAATGGASGLLLVALGTVLWWIGHLHYALRHGVWKSALAARVYEGFLAAWQRLGRRAEVPPPGGDLRVLAGGGRTRGDDQPEGE
jgi:hypothetical protein